MASIEVPISDEKILALLQEKYGLVVGSGMVTKLDVHTEAPVSNSTISHMVKVQISFPLDLGVVEDLVGF